MQAANTSISNIQDTIYHINTETNSNPDYNFVSGTTQVGKQYEDTHFYTNSGIAAGAYTLSDIINKLAKMSHTHSTSTTRRDCNCNCNCNCQNYGNDGN